MTESKGETMYPIELRASDTSTLEIGVDHAQGTWLTIYVGATGKSLTFPKGSPELVKLRDFLTSVIGEKGAEPDMDGLLCGWRDARTAFDTAAIRVTTNPDSPSYRRTFLDAIRRLRAAEDAICREDK